MAYLKINDVDYSMYVNVLKIGTNHNYNAQTNAAGDTVVDYINAKRQINVGIIPLNADAMTALKTALDGFNVALSFLNPTTGVLEENVNCIAPSSEVEYYTIRVGNTSFKAFEITFIEL